MKQAHILVHYQQALDYFNLVVFGTDYVAKYSPIMSRMDKIANLSTTRFVNEDPSVVPNGLDKETNYLVCGSARRSYPKSRGSCPKSQLDALHASGHKAEFLDDAIIEPIPIREFMKLLSD